MRPAPVQGMECTSTLERGDGSIELHISCGPRPDAQASDSVESQLRATFESLARALDRAQARPFHVVSQRLHLADAEAAVPAARALQHEFYGEPENLPQPASSHFCLPPSRPGQLVALQAQVVLPPPGKRSKGRWVSPRDGHETIRIVEEGDLRWVHVGNCVPSDRMPHCRLEPKCSESQALEMFTWGREALRTGGALFRDVVRSWIFVRNIQWHQRGLDRARVVFFENEHLTRPPASTQVQGQPHPSEMPCGMDLLAVQGSDQAQIELLHAPAESDMADRPALAGGMKVTTSTRTALFISATASTDDRGALVFPGDRVSQARRVFANIRSLLEAQGATMQDLVSLTSYLKDPDFHHEFGRLCLEAGIGLELPHTTVVAESCRPGALLEVEGLAVL